MTCHRRQRSVHTRAQLRQQKPLLGRFRKAAWYSGRTCVSDGARLGTHRRRLRLRLRQVAACPRWALPCPRDIWVEGIDRRRRA